MFLSMTGFFRKFGKKFIIRVEDQFSIEFSFKITKILTIFSNLIDFRSKTQSLAAGFLNFSRVNKDFQESKKFP